MSDSFAVCENVKIPGLVLLCDKTIVDMSAWHNRITFCYIFLLLCQIVNKNLYEKLLMVHKIQAVPSACLMCQFLTFADKYGYPFAICFLLKLLTVILLFCILFQVCILLGFVTHDIVAELIQNYLTIQFPLYKNTSFIINYVFIFCCYKLYLVI